MASRKVSAHIKGVAAVSAFGGAALAISEYPGIGLALLAAISFLSLVLNPAIGLMLMTSGRYLYFIGLLLLTGRNGDSTVTPFYFLAVDCLVLFGLILSRRWRLSGPTALYILMSLFLASALLSWFIAGSNAQGLFWVGALIVFALLPLLATLGLTPRQVNSTCKCMFWAVVAVSLVYAYQALMGQLSWWYGRAGIRVRDVPAVGSLFLATVLPIGVYGTVFLGTDSAHARASGRNLLRVLRFVIIAFFCVLLVLAGERTAVLAFGFSFVIFFLTTRRVAKAVLVVAGMVIASTTPLLTQSGDRFAVFGNFLSEGASAIEHDETAASRIAYYRVAFATFLNSPLTGTGPGTFSEIASDYTKTDKIPHNALLEVAYSQGLLGLIPISGVIVLTGLQATRRLRSRERGDRSETNLVSFLYILWLFMLIVLCGTGSFLGDSVFWVCTGGIWVLCPASKHRFRRVAKHSSDLASPHPQMLSVNV